MKVIKIRNFAVLSFAFIGLILFGRTPMQAAVESIDDYIRNLDRLLPSLAGKYGVDGAAVAVVHNGEAIKFLGFGYADKATRKPITKDTGFQVASISKPLAAWGVMRLVERNLLNLDVPVETYLTRWHLPESPFNRNGVTIRRLLSHTAGLSVDGYSGLEPDKPLPTLEESLSGRTSDSGVLRIFAGPLRIQMEPGTQWSYSGGGYTLLQLVIEEVSRQSFTEYMQQNILTPLGMNQSSFSWNPRIQKNVAIPYGWWGNALPNYLFAEKAAAGLYTTAPDLAKFVAANMNGPAGETPGRGVLTSETVALSMRPNPVNHAYGFGLSISQLSKEVSLIHHSGSNIGWKSRIMFIPSQGNGIVIITNSDRGWDLIKDLCCDWLHWAAGEQPGFVCDQSGRIKMAYIAAGLFMPLVIFTGWRVLEFGTGRRHLQIKLSRGRVVRLGVIVILLAGWWIGLYQGIVIAGYFPFTFHWISLAYTLWMLVLLVFTFAHKKPKSA
jgi:CubicO group peptidase (beta-lactamase class C family)